MIKLKQLFKGLISEQATDTAKLGKGIPSAEDVDATTAAITKLGDAMKDAGLTETELDEAELVNHMYDYKGGVEYILRDPAQAMEVAESITRWTERKGFTIIKQNISKSGKIGYFLFRIGQDPERDAQRIQGYFSSKIEIEKYRFKVRQPKRRMRAQQETPQI